MALAHTVHVAYSTAASEQQKPISKRYWTVYLSAEFLIGRLLSGNFNQHGSLRTSLSSACGVGLNLDDLPRTGREEPGLGNGSLGRLLNLFFGLPRTLEIPVLLATDSLRELASLIIQEWLAKLNAASGYVWQSPGNPPPWVSGEVKFRDHTGRTPGADGHYHVQWISEPERYLAHNPRYACSRVWQQHSQ